MVLSKRERRIFWLTAVVMTLLISDRFVISPAFNALESIGTEKQRLSDDVRVMEGLLANAGARTRQWRDMVDRGLLDEPSAAQSSMLNILEDWAYRSRFRLTAVTPQRSPSDRPLRDISFTLAGKGDMASIGEFVWLIEQTEMPVKIDSLTLGSTNATGRDLTLGLKLSLLYRTVEEKS